MVNASTQEIYVINAEKYLQKSKYKLYDNTIISDKKILEDYCRYFKTSNEQSTNAEEIEMMTLIWLIVKSMMK